VPAHPPVYLTLRCTRAVFSDWEKIAQEAIENAQMGEDEDEDYDALEQEILGEKPSGIQ
jgi:hypothetical protein